MPDQVRNRPWVRYHDNPKQPLRGQAPTFRVSSLDDVIRICRRGGRAGSRKLRAAGSHWALSTTALSDDVQVETHHKPTERFPAMGKTLYDVVPGCLRPEFIQHLANMQPEPFDATTNPFNEGLYPFHFETGKRVYQAYAELNLGDDTDDRSLAHLLATPPYRNEHYRGPWAFATLGGAGGQTVFGALNTGTHGADFLQPPIADAVLAMHLVVDGGKHYWVERGMPVMDVQMTDDDLLKLRYQGAAGGQPEDFEVIREDDFFNALLVSAGRFGIVYSVVVGAVRQYMLHQERRLDLPATWNEITGQVSDTGSELFSRALPVPLPQPAVAAGAPVHPQKFTQVAVLLSPLKNGNEHQVAVSRRWNFPFVAGPSGRAAGEPERVGMPGAVNRKTNAVEFSAAGKMHAYTPNPNNPWEGAAPGFLDRACSDPDFVKGAVRAVVTEVNNFVNSGGKAVAGGTIVAVAAVAALAGPVGLLLLLAALAFLLPLLIHFINELDENADRLGGALDHLREILLEPADPAHKEAGLLLWRCIALELFKQLQSDSSYAAVSYAVMDGHNYTDKSCLIHGDSVEVFFDADGDDYKLFLDGVLATEQRQEWDGRAFVGYASLRFTGKTSALLGPEVWDRTCVFEIAGLADVKGSKELIAYAEHRARDRDLNARLHWGQKTEVTEKEVERWFGDSVAKPGGRLGTWRAALARVTDNGRLDRFSSAFTRRAGLEVVQPLVGHVDVSADRVALRDEVVVDWDCTANPPGTTVTVTMLAPRQRQPRQVVAPTTVLSGATTDRPTTTGRHLVTVKVSFTTPGGVERIDETTVEFEAGRL